MYGSSVTTGNLVASHCDSRRIDSHATDPASPEVARRVDPLRFRIFNNNRPDFYTSHLNHSASSYTMANPRQRNKARSSKTTKPSLNMKRRMHQKARRAPPLKGPEVLQAQWDKKKTVFQK